MAKPYVAEFDGGRYSDIVLGRVIPGGDSGWNFEAVNIPWSDDLVAGTVYKRDGTPLATGDSADLAFGVLVDRKVLPGVRQFEGTLEDDEAVPFVLAVRGVTLNFYKLKFADGSQITDTVANALEANGSNQVTKHVVGTQFIGSVL